LSDHWSVRIGIDLKEVLKNIHFLFESFWLKDPQLIDKIKGLWERDYNEGKQQDACLPTKVEGFESSIKALEQEKIWEYF